ncbi:ATPase [Planotetraspora sp. A-T 1434]|uniref:N-acetylglucosamine kinase n=1 Tax=Planotetraspora sp. A-T 1434 TaxID=2979219 RepID=UPI0021BE3C9E|nr:BadF/BadG/BcrA/BcrD ATPase family protein [Planotetraspora sp. A-T 1434]MCT9934406.1 ATPase [Planotetraspora sp. A-T 1434]
MIGARSGTDRPLRTLLAVDGGNSKTDVAFVREDGTVLARARGAGFVPHSAGVAAAIDVVGETVRRALASRPGLHSHLTADLADGALDGHSPDGHVDGHVDGHLDGLRTRVAVPYADHIAAYVAGADLPIEEDRLRDELLARGYGRSVAVSNDTFALLRAGASTPWGVAVVCGAGINAVGVAPSGKVARFPALGTLSGDWGGGYGLGEQTIFHAIRAEDGRGPETALVDVVRTCFGTRTVEEVVIAIHFGDLSIDRVHDLVPPLLVAARTDAIARSLIERLADEVVAMGTVAMRRIDLLGVPCEVVLGGGVMTAGDPLLMPLIEQRFAEKAPHARLVVADVPPIVGAALLGLDRLGAPAEAYDRVREYFLSPSQEAEEEPGSGEDAVPAPAPVG